MGLSTCWLTYFEPDVIKKQFNIPNNLEPIAIIAIGYAAGAKASIERHSKERKNSEDITRYETFKKKNWECMICNRLRK